MKRRLLAVAVLLAVAGAVTIAAVRSVRPRVLSEVEGWVLSPPTGSDRWVAWLEGDEAECRLMAARRHGGRARVALTGRVLSGLAVTGDSAFVTRADEPEGDEAGASLLRVDLRTGTSEVLARLTTGAQSKLDCRQIAFGDGWLCWREEREAALPEVPFVVAAAALTVLRARSTNGVDDVHTLAIVSARPRGGKGQTELVGIAGAQAYWLERRTSGSSETTVLRRVALPRGEPETLIREAGRRAAVLTQDALVWTAASLEGAEASQFLAVKQRSLRNGAVKVIADWLSTSGELQASRDEVYVQGRSWLWRLGSERGEQRRLRRCPGGFVTARVVGDEQYLVLRSRDGLAVAARPLTWWSRIRSFITAMRGIGGGR